MFCLWTLYIVHCSIIYNTYLEMGCIDLAFKITTDKMNSRGSSMFHYKQPKNQMWINALFDCQFTQWWWIEWMAKYGDTNSEHRWLLCVCVCVALFVSRTDRMAQLRNVEATARLMLMSIHSAYIKRWLTTHNINRDIIRISDNAYVYRGEWASTQNCKEWRNILNRWNLNYYYSFYFQYFGR